MEIAVQKLAMNLLIWLLRLLFDITFIFRKLAGLDNVGDTDLVSLFLNNERVEKIFFNIFIISVIVAAIAMIVAIIKAFVNLNGGERKSIKKITGQGIGSIFISLLMAGIMISGIFFSNSLLREVNRAFNPGEEGNICNDLFDISVDDEAYIMVPEYEYVTKKDAFGNTLTDLGGSPIYEYEKDENGDYVYEKNENGEYCYNEYGEKIKVKQKVYVTDSDGNIIYDSSGNPTPVVKSYTRQKLADKNGWTETGKNKKQDSEWCITQENADTVLGTYPHDLFNPFENPSKTPTMEGLIYYGSFNFFLGYLATILVLVAMVSACLGLVKRMYDLVVLFLSLPLIASTIPLDDGARFKVWRETVISKVVLAYGAVFAVNVFMIMLPIITGSVSDKILRMLLVVGGGLSISGGMLIFARIFGTDATESREMAQSARTLLSGGKVATLGVAGLAMKASRIGGAGIKGAGAALGFLGKRIRLGDDTLTTGANSASKLATSSNALGLTAQASAGSNLGKIMSNPGIQSGTWAKDPTTGRFMSKSKIAELAKSGSKK